MPDLGWNKECTRLTGINPENYGAKFSPLWKLRFHRGWIPPRLYRYEMDMDDFNNLKFVIEQTYNVSNWGTSPCISELPANERIRGDFMHIEIEKLKYFFIGYYFDAEHEKLYITIVDGF